MHQTIIELWRGNIAPYEHCGSRDEEATQLLELMEQNREVLCKGLTAAQAEIFHRYISCADDYLLRMTEIAFCDGFCLGGKLAAEALI